MIHSCATIAACRQRWLTIGSLVFIAIAAILRMSFAGTTDVLPHARGNSQTVRKAIKFTLQDQYGTLHAYRIPSDKVSVLFFADRAGSGQLEPWIQPLYERYQESIAIYGVADLSAVPAFLQGVVALFMRRQVQYPVMLDWTGTIAHAYTYAQGQAHLILVNTQGDIVFTVTGAVNKQKLAGVLSQIDGLLSTPPH